MASTDYISNRDAKKFLNQIKFECILFRFPEFLYILYNIVFIEDFLAFLYQVMRKLQKFLQRQRGMAEKGNTLAKCLQNKDLNKAVTKVFMLMVIFSCRACSKAVDYSHQSVLKLHCQSQSHKENMSKKDFTQAKNANDNNVCSKMV